MCIGVPGQCWLSVRIFTSLRRLEVCGIKRDVNIALICERNPADLLGQWVLVARRICHEHHRRR
ncbi:HypC/HybG/HupF family hydrogenase formation chaperone [Escherichia coli]|nr:HypC/HybG/HupF family hydrogenase formation chaperone [Escherichia coli]